MSPVTQSCPFLSRTKALLGGLLLGVLAGAGAVYAHYTGFLVPLYHLVGLHGTAKQAASHEQTGADHLGHAARVGQGVTTPGGTQASSVPGYAVVAVDPQRQQLIGLRTGKVVRDELVMSLRTVGIIEPDQTRLAQIHTRISGWVTKVHVNFVGRSVKKDDPLLELYSPELLTAQSDYVVAVRAAELKPDDRIQQQIADVTRRRLELWGVSADEVQQLRKTKEARDTLLLRAPIGGRVLERTVVEGSYVEPATELYRIADLSTLWLQAKVYEHELPHVEPGQPVRVTLPSQPGKTFDGKVAFVEPVLQEMSRTVKVRVELPNPDDALKPGMFADLEIRHPMGTGLLVPESAVLRTGTRAVAFRTLPEGRFEPVEVKLGGRFGERFEVLAGLAEGDEVVTSGNFLIDSDSRLKSVAAGAGGEHRH